MSDRTTRTAIWTVRGEPDIDRYVRAEAKRTCTSVSTVIYRILREHCEREAAREGGAMA